MPAFALHRFLVSLRMGRWEVNFLSLCVPAIAFNLAAMNFPRMLQACFFVLASLLCCQWEASLWKLFFSPWSDLPDAIPWCAPVFVLRLGYLERFKLFGSGKINLITSPLFVLILEFLLVKCWTSDDLLSLCLYLSYTLGKKLLWFFFLIILLNIYFSFHFSLCVPRVFSSLIVPYSEYFKFPGGLVTDIWRFQIVLLVFYRCRPQSCLSECEL